ncbi:MAG TPA: MBL fold metallo-hydrolase [Candidatus Limnocylindrales bacterium]|nr:MBL fold metallo-hydrolase [Candidatus Limnocylindrales bacterium]
MRPKYGVIAGILIAACAAWAASGVAARQSVGNGFVAKGDGGQATVEAKLPFTLKQVGRNVWAAIDLDGRSGANAGFVVGDDGVAVIDTFEHAEAARALLAEIHKKTSLPIKFVINTHYHIDHVSGNGAFAELGAVVMAQRNVRAWIHTENMKFFGWDKAKPDQKTWVEGLFAPEVVYDTGVTVYLGSRELDVKVFPGHTGGDSVVKVRDENGNDVVFCGDLFWRHSLPNLIDATTARWVETLDELPKWEPREGTVFVPGHGDVGNAQDVAAFRGYLTDLRAMVAGPVKEGKSGDALVAAVMPELTQKYGDWGIFKHFANRNILDMAAEIQGTKRVPQPVAAQ